MARSLPSSPTITSSATSVKAASSSFSSSRAQKWVLTSAMVTALVYLVRHLVEGETSPAPATSTARQFLGQGSPPSFGQWALAYGIGYGMLALLAVAAPEIAAGLAMFGLAVVFLESGGQLATDLQDLEHGTAGTGNSPVTGITGTASAGGTGTAGVSGSLILPAPAPSPSSAGAKALVPASTIIGRFNADLQRLANAGKLTAAQLNGTGFQLNGKTVVPVPGATAAAGRAQYARAVQEGSLAMP